MASNEPRDKSSEVQAAVDLALLKAQVTNLVAASQQTETRVQGIFNEITASLRRLTEDLLTVRERQKDVGRDIHDARVEIGAVKQQVDNLQAVVGAKVGISFFRALWYALIGVLALIGSVVGIIAGLRSAGILH